MDIDIIGIGVLPRVGILPHLTLQNKPRRMIGSCYSGDHIAGYDILTDITKCNIEEPPWYGGRGRGLNMFHWIRFCSGSKHLVRMKVSLPINDTKRETNKSRIRPMMKQR